VQGAVVEFRMYKAELIQRTQRRIEENRTQNRIAQALEKPSKVGGDGIQFVCISSLQESGLL